jgi:hypothetical protein
MFLPKLDDTGFPINYRITHPLDLSFNTDDLLLARDLIRTCNDMIERNNEEAKSNPLIQSLIAANKYLKYDENACKYYIDETMYKLKVFEDRYSDYNKQLPVLLEGIKYYGYTISQKDHIEEVSSERKEAVEFFLKECRSKKYNETTKQTLSFLSRINDNNIDIYREIIKGNLDILRGKDDNNFRIREDNAIYAESIEIVERNTPIVLSLYKYYNCDTIKDIYEYCIEKKQNRINYTKLNRIRKFINIVNNIRKQRLDFPIYKFVTDAKRFAIENPIVSKDDLTQWINEYSVKIANNIKDVVVEDVMFLEVIKEHIEELWKIIVTQSRPKDGKITLSPFELLWQTKDSLDTVYGGNITKTFFMQELIDEMKPEEIVEESYLPKIDENEILPEIEVTSKVSLNTVKDEVQNIVNKDYDYYKYSEQDGSNERFMEKQKNTNAFRDTIFDIIDDNKPKEEKPKDDIETLF